MSAWLRACLLFTLTVESSDAATLTGLVTDPSDARVIGAVLTLLSSNQAVMASAVTEADGRFRISVPRPGTYTLQVSKAGFSPQRLAVEVSDYKPTEVTLRLSLAPLPSAVVVTAEAGRSEAADQTVRRVNNISRGQLEQRASTVLADVLREEPGLDVQRTAPVMGGVAVRGLLGKNVAVYRDGVRYTTSAQRGGVSTFFNLQETSHLDAIEVSRGPDSAQYGSDAVGGTVHLLSRSAPLGAPGWRGEFAPTYSSAAHAFGGNLLASVGGSRYGLVANLAARRVNTLRAGGGIDTHAAVTRFLGLPSSILGERLADTAFTQYGSFLHAQVALSPARQVIFHYERGQQDGAKRPDQLAGGDGNLIADLRNLMLDFGYVRYSQFALGPFDQASAGFSYNAQREERVNQGGNGDPLGRITHQYERTEVWGASFFVTRRAGRHQTLLGGDGYRERATAPAFVFDPVRSTVSPSRPRIPDGGLYRTYGLYAHQTWDARLDGSLRVIGALRFGGASYRSRGTRLWPDDSADANAVTGRAGATWRVASPVRVHASYSRGFREPSMTDLGTAGLQGNGFFEASYASLAGRGATIGTRADDRAVSSGRAVQPVRSESSDHFEGGVQLSASRLRIQASGFALRLHDTLVSQTLILPAGSAGQMLGDQLILRQLATGAVFVQASTAPVQVRGNLGGVRLEGVELALDAPLSRALALASNFTKLSARDQATGAPPDLEGGIPPATAHARLRWAPKAGRWWAEPYATLAGRQGQLSSLALADRRTGAARSRANIASFFNNGARVRGLVVNGVLAATGETLAQVQNRVLGSADSAPLVNAVPGYALFGLRGGWHWSERATLFVDFSNLLDRSHRGVSWGVDGAGRAVTLKYRYEF